VDILNRAKKIEKYQKAPLLLLRRMDGWMDGWITGAVGYTVPPSHKGCLALPYPHTYIYVWGRHSKPCLQAVRAALPIHRRLASFGGIGGPPCPSPPCHLRPLGVRSMSTQWLPPSFYSTVLFLFFSKRTLRLNYSKNN